MADLIPIPDLQNLDIKTYTICWPDSAAFEGLLTGFISMPSAPGFWDPETGDIDAALTVGDQLLGLNAGIAERELKPMTCFVPVDAQPLIQSDQVILLSAGNEVIDHTPPAGEVWLVTQLSVVVITANPSLARLSVNHSTIEQYLRAVATPGQGVPVTWEGKIMVDENATVRLRANGLGISDQVRFGLFGWRWTV